MYVYYYIIVWRGRIVSTCPIKMYIELNPVSILFVLLFLKDINLRCHGWVWLYDWNYSICSETSNFKKTWRYSKHRARGSSQIQPVPNELFLVKMVSEELIPKTPPLFKKKYNDCIKNCGSRHSLMGGNNLLLLFYAVDWWGWLFGLWASSAWFTEVFTQGLNYGSLTSFQAKVLNVDLYVVQYG